MPYTAMMLTLLNALNLGQVSQHDSSIALVMVAAVYTRLHTYGSGAYGQ